MSRLNCTRSSARSQAAWHASPKATTDDSVSDSKRALIGQALVGGGVRRETALYGPPEKDVQLSLAPPAKKPRFFGDAGFVGPGNLHRGWPQILYSLPPRCDDRRRRDALLPPSHGRPHGVLPLQPRRGGRATGRRRGHALPRVPRGAGRERPIAPSGRSTSGAVEPSAPLTAHE